MIIVIVKGVADIGKLLGGTGKHEIALTSGSDLNNLLDILVEKYGPALFERLYINNGRELRKDLRLLVNGQDIVFLNGLNTELKEGDRFSIIPPLMGG
ncbi:MAG: MoaD family protein [Bacillota bacterium]|nr:MoaD family protein [Bacillota bacterium]